MPKRTNGADSRYICDDCGGQYECLLVDVAQNDIDKLCWTCLIKRAITLLEALQQPVEAS